MPGLPGAAWSSVSAGLAARRQASACSRAPEPTRSTFTPTESTFAVRGRPLRGSARRSRGRSDEDALAGGADADELDRDPELALDELDVAAGGVR